MARIETELVANGVIDTLNNKVVDVKWQILRSKDNYTRRDKYNVYIGGSYCGEFPTIKDALEVIVNHFG